MSARMRRYFRYADDATESVGTLIRLRAPWLIIGLSIGTLITLLVSRFEDVLSQQVSLAFFIPLIVYMSDAVGTQTETIYVRNLNTRAKETWFSRYLIKELAVGLIVGICSGLIMAGVAWFWLKDAKLAITVGLAMLASMTAAAAFALIIPTFLHHKTKIDPAVVAGPFTTVLQDMLSLTIYFLIASAIIL